MSSVIHISLRALYTNYFTLVYVHSPFQPRRFPIAVLKQYRVIQHMCAIVTRYQSCCCCYHHHHHHYYYYYESGDKVILLLKRPPYLNQAARKDIKAPNSSLPLAAGLRMQWRPSRIPRPNGERARGDVSPRENRGSRANAYVRTYVRTKHLTAKSQT